MYSEMLTPEMLETVLPLLGFSLLLNVLLLVALIFKSVRHRLGNQILSLRVGLRMISSSNEQSSQGS